MVISGQLDELPKERVFEEFQKLLCRGIKPSIGLEFIRYIGIIDRYFPELSAIIGVKQEHDWHSEGDVWTHTMMVTDAGVNYRQELVFPTAFMFACLCHDLGKPDTTAIIDGRITTRKHEEVGESISRNFMSRLTNNIQLIEQVAFMVRHHLLPHHWYIGKPIKKSTAIRLYRKLESLGLDYRYISYISHVDNVGRIVQPAYDGAIRDNFAKGRWFEDLMKSLTFGPEQTKAMVALVTGKDLIAMGLRPGPKFKEILEAAYTYQLDNNITDKDLVLKFVVYGKY
jgi:tRNA nucleotidyltransferase (CCA-adding enzyme)